MKINYITIMVRNIEKSLDFYTKVAGLKIVRRFNPGQGEIAFVSDKEGDTMLELIQFDEAPKVSTEGLVMSFLAEDKLEEIREKLTSLGYNPSDIKKIGPKPAHFTVSDPDNITIEFSEK